MEILDWLNKNISQIKTSLVFGKYFDSILMEKGTNVFFLINPEKGIDIILTPELIVKSIHLYSNSLQGINMFQETLPLKLDFNLSRNETRELLGKPLLSGGGGNSLLYGTVPTFDKYFFTAGFYLHITFNDNLEKINLISIDFAHFDPIGAAL